MTSVKPLAPPVSTPELQRPPLRALVRPEPARPSATDNRRSTDSAPRPSLLSFARTKIARPRSRPGAMLARPALGQRLAEALAQRSLVLITAAAGFGKTTALNQALDALPAGTAIAWVGCDEGDSPLQLFSCLVAALEPFDLPWRAAPESLIGEAAGLTEPAAQLKALRRMVTELINALDAADVPHGVIAVDDLHRVTHPAVFQFVDLLLERFTPRWTMAVATRHDPPLALARLRATGELAEFIATDLRFTEAQTRELAQIAGMELDVADALFVRTEGWPAGLQLALNVLRSTPGASLSGTASLIDRQVFDFLAAEVLDRLPRELREFLLTTSVLPELAAARCAALTGDERAAEKLDAIERAGLFVSVLADQDAAHGTLPTLRLHDLFRDALEHHLQRERPGHWPELLRRAAASESDPLRRVGGLLRAEAWSDAEAALAEVGEELITQGDVAAVGSLLDRFPSAQRQGSGRLLLLGAKLAWSRWDWRAMNDGACAASAAFTRIGNTAGQAHAISYQALSLVATERVDEALPLIDALLAHANVDHAVAARALMARAWIEFSHGDQRRVGVLWAQLMDHLERIPALANWYECMPIPSYASLPGMRHALARYVHAAKARWPDRPSPPRGMCTVIEGLLHLWGGDVDRAQSCALQAADDAKWLGQPVNLDAYATLLLAFLHAVQGRGLAAQSVFEQQIEAVMATGDEVRIGMYRGVYLYAAMRCAAAADDLERLVERAAQLLAHEQSGPVGARPGLIEQYAACARAYAATAAGNHPSACDAWRALIEREHEIDHYAQVPEARLRLAAALLQLRRPARDAAAVLAPLFDRIEASGEHGLALMAGATVLHQLAQADWSAQLDPHRVQRLQRWAASVAAPMAPASRTQAAIAPAFTESSPISGRAASIGLSERELEVLERLAAGDSNKLIARAFDLSPHTVKRHVANILDKLDLRSRGQVAAWYHEHHGLR